MAKTKTLGDIGLAFVPEAAEEKTEKAAEETTEEKTEKAVEETTDGDATANGVLPAMLGDFNVREWHNLGAWFRNHGRPKDAPRKAPRATISYRDVYAHLNAPQSTAQGEKK
jgi:hypothetical protein